MIMMMMMEMARKIMVILLKHVQILSIMLRVIFAIMARNDYCENDDSTVHDGTIKITGVMMIMVKDLRHENSDN